MKTLFNRDLTLDIAIIAEIGVNHEGSLDKALELLELAAENGADAVKFQSYTPKRFTTSENKERFERVSRFCLGKDEHIKIYERAKSLGVDFLSTPVTEDWIPFLNEMCGAFKIASGDMTFRQGIQAAAETGKPVLLSTGASNEGEIRQAIDWVRDVVGEDLLDERLHLLHCISSYPTPIEEANVLSVPYLQEKFGLRVGYSNHVIGSDACLAAVALGASIVEVHFTDNKFGRDFRDHEISFDPKDLKDFTVRARNIRKSLGKYEKVVQNCERDIVQAIRKGLVVSRDLKEGALLTEDDLVFARPATEFTSEDLGLVIGKRVNRELKEGQVLRKVDLCVE